MALRVWKRWLVLACAWGAAAGGAAAGEPAWLLKAAAQGDTAKVLEQLKEGVPVDVPDGGGNTPLLLATQGNHVDTARVLIDAGANVNAQNTRLDSAYLLAGAAGRLDILRMTLAHGANLKSTNRYGGTALIPACERGHVEVVRVLLDAGVDVNHVNNLGWTGLLEAILLGDGGPRHQQIVRLLIDRGANVNLADGQGVTPLEHARARGQKAIADMLVAAGAR
jgi:ankyrin repeat protein